jgi:hypothetical protein
MYQYYQSCHGSRSARFSECGRAYDAILHILGTYGANLDLFLVNMDIKHPANAKMLMADLLVWGLLQELEAALRRLWADDCEPIVNIRHC